MSNEDERKNLTLLLQAWQAGDDAAFRRLMSLVYEDLAVIARKWMRQENRPGHTLNTVALVNEAYLKLSQMKTTGAADRGQFFGMAAKLMRQVLVDHARQRNAQKRGGEVERIYLSSLDGLSDERAVELVRLDESLQKLAAHSPRKAEIVELKFFAGMQVEEIAVLLKVSAATVKRDWVFSRAWLSREMTEPPDS